MKFQVALLLITCLSVALSEPLIPRNDSVIGKGLKHYDIDNDLPYAVRWQAVLRDYKPVLREFVDFILSDLNATQPALWALGEWAKEYYWNRNFVKEIQDIATIYEEEFYLVFAFNLFYELHTFGCTSIVLRDSTGRIIHVRNLDYFAVEYISRFTYEATVYEGGKPLYSGVFMAGSVLLETGVRHGAFAISGNERNRGNNKWADAYSMFFVNSYPAGYLIHDVLRSEDTFEKAVKRFKETDIISNMYAVVSGIKYNEGIIIEMERYRTHAVYQLDEVTWYLVQSNYDRDMPDPPTDPRRTVAEQWIQNIGQQEVNEKILMEEVLFQFPLFNTMTLHSTTMSAVRNYFNNTLWY